MNENLWTVRELSGFLSLSPAAVRSMLKRREIPENCVRRVGKRRLRFIPGAVREWLNLAQSAT